MNKKEIAQAQELIDSVRRGDPPRMVEAVFPQAMKPQHFTSYCKLGIHELRERKYFRGKFVAETPHYFEVLSSALGGRCGHRHKTQAGAKPCLEKFKEMLASRRRRLTR